MAALRRLSAPESPDGHEQKSGRNRSVFPARRRDCPHFRSQYQGSLFADPITSPEGLERLHQPILSGDGGRLFTHGRKHLHPLAADRERE